MSGPVGGTDRHPATRGGRRHRAAVANCHTLRALVDAVYASLSTNPYLPLAVTFLSCSALLALAMVIVLWRRGPAELMALSEGEGPQAAAR